MADIRKSARARVLSSMHPMSHNGETQCRALGSLEWWPFCRPFPQRRCWPRQWSRSQATALSSTPTQTAKIKGQAIRMAIMSNPPPKGMIGRAVKPLAWHRSERAPTDPALTAALKRWGTESGPPGIEARRPITRGGWKRRFDEPIPLPRRQLVTLNDAGWPAGVPRAFGVTCRSYFPATPSSAPQSTWPRHAR